MKKKLVTKKKNNNKKNHLSSIEFNIGDYKSNVNYTSTFPQEKNIAPPRNFDDLVNYPETIKAMKEIKYNFLEEHKNIINTYYSIYSNRLHEILDCDLNNLMSIEKYSKTYDKINRDLLDNQTNTIRIIDDIVVKNMGTFIKSIELVHKFYFDVIQSYYNYITNLKNPTDK